MIHQQPQFEYPERPKLFIVEFIDAMIGADVAADLGADVFTLLTIVVRQEDRIGCTRAVGFWNSQLRRHLGCAEATLRAIRNKAIKSGWLVYRPTPNGSPKPAEYYVQIPAQTPGSLARGQEQTPSSSVQGQRGRPRQNGYIDPVKSRTSTPSANVHLSSLSSSSLVSSSLSSCRKLRFDEEDLELSRWMFGKIRDLQPERKEPNFDKWADDIRLMRERDGRSPPDIRELFEWCNNDEFWRTNILSPSKLRQKWDDLQLRRKCSHNGKSNTNKIGPGQRYDPSAPTQSTF